MTKPKIELQVGQIWGVPPMEKTLDVRTIHFFLETIQLPDSDTIVELEYYDIAATCWEISTSDFRAWITRKGAILIGHYDFKTRKAVSVR